MAKPISEATMKLFTDIFRFILPDVNPSNKEALAPGELGINYESGVFYFRDPTTLEIRTPNSVEALKFIENRYNYDSDELTADRIGGLKFYTSVTHLPDVTDINSVSIDTMISKMQHPAIMYAQTETDSYETLGLPAKSGLLSIIKVSDTACTLQFYDTQKSISYTGQYSGSTKQFLYWIRDEDTMANFGIASGDGTSQSVTVAKSDIEDLDTVTIKVTNDVQPTATWSINGSTAARLYDTDGNLIDTGLIKENSIIMLIRDNVLGRWVLADLNKTIIYQTTRILSSRLSGSSNFIEAYADRINSMETWLLSNAGKFITSNSLYTCTADGTTTIPVSDYDVENDVLLVNYNQTILRCGIDYSIKADGSSISLLTTTINKDETIQFIVIRQNKYTITT